VACVLVHAFCNALGFPDLSWLSSASQNPPRRLIIAAAYITGIGLFTAGFYPLTSPHLFGSFFFKK
jgi:prenyl protein peptidase